MKNHQDSCLKSYYLQNTIEAGCDEAGRGCLAGPVFAAAVILPEDYKNELIQDSKKLSEQLRDKLRQEIESVAISWAVEKVDEEEIDKINILKASIMAMHKAIAKLDPQPQHIIVDGNRFLQYRDTPHTTIVKGDAQYLSIAASSILAKTHRDKHMAEMAKLFPQYGWDKNKGYPTADHRQAIAKFGPSPLHRKSFKLLKSEDGKLQQNLF